MEEVNRKVQGEYTIIKPRAIVQKGKSAGPDSLRGKERVKVDKKKKKRGGQGKPAAAKLASQSRGEKRPRFQLGEGQPVSTKREV